MYEIKLINPSLLRNNYVPDNYIVLIITSLLRNNYVPVRNKSLLFHILNLPFRVRATPFITESFFYLCGG